MLDALHYREKLSITSREMLGMPRKHCVAVANQLMEGTLVLDYFLPETYAYQREQIPWEIKASSSVKLYLQGLTPVSFLAGAYALNSAKREYFQLAKEFVESWIAFAPSVAEPKSNCYIWDQHAAALRTEALLYYLLIGNENGLLSRREQHRVQRVLIKHGNFLADSKFYLSNENHGVFQDRALIYLGYALGNRKWVNLARSRVIGQWRFLFGENGACVENSYAYQNLNKELFGEIIHFLRSQDDDMSQELCSEIAKAERFMGYALMPDERAPAYGDSFRSNFHGVKTFDSTGPLAYATGNPNAPVPAWRSAVYPKEGYYFGREFWGSHEESGRNLLPSDATWVMMRSGYKTLTHRHGDDNSFMLYGRGCEIFTDPGKYNSQYRDPIRQYIRSANAHNTVVVDGKSYDFLRMDLKGQSGILHYELHSGLAPDYVVAFSKLYCGVTHIRHFLYWKTDVLLVDELRSINEHQYSQLFHCGIRIRVDKMDDSGAFLRIGDGMYGLSLRQMLRCDSFALHYGKEQGIRYGNVSEAFNQLTKTNTLQYDRKGDVVCFVTHLVLTDQDGTSLSGMRIELDSLCRVLSISSPEHQSQMKLYRAEPDELGIRFVLPMDKVRVEVIGDRIVFTNTAEYSCLVDYAWYLLAGDGKTVLQQVRYNSSPCYELTLDQAACREGEMFFVRGFVLTRQGNQKATQNLAKVLIQDGKPVVQMILDYDTDLQGWLAQEKKEGIG